MATTIISRLSVAEVEEPQVTYLVAQLLGHQPSLGFGDEVVLDARIEESIVAPLYIAGIDRVTAAELSQEVLALFGVPHADALVLELSAAYRTQLPPNPQVTLLSLYPEPVEAYG